MAMKTLREKCPGHTDGSAMLSASESSSTFFCDFFFDVGLSVLQVPTPAPFRFPGAGNFATFDDDFALSGNTASLAAELGPACIQVTHQYTLHTEFQHRSNNKYPRRNTQTTPLMIDLPSQQQTKTQALAVWLQLPLWMALHLMQTFQFLRVSQQSTL